MHTNDVRISERDAAAGAAVYSKAILSIYDLFVVSFSNTFAWKCSAGRILDFYNENIGARHLDVGVGTGYYLDKCRFPTQKPTLALMDLNPNSLEVTAKRLRRYHPTTHVANVLEPLALDGVSFDSIGVNYLLHCLPGPMASKGVVFQHLTPFLAPGGVVFGTTILGQGVPHNALGRFLMTTYNKKGIFGNLDDSQAGLEHILRENFGAYRVWIEGCVAFFSGTKL